MWAELARGQAGVVSRAQALAAGMTPGTIRANVRAGRWARLYRGVYATFTGPPSRRGLMWAALLRAGAGAVLSHHSAAEVQGLIDTSASLIHVTIPAARTADRFPGVVVHRSTRLAAARHPTRTPPQTRVEETVLDLTQVAHSLDEAMGWLARAVGARLTTPDRLAATIDKRGRVRWRRPMLAALRDVGDGCHSLLELRYLRLVERTHCLPPADRQAPTAPAATHPTGGPRRYRDVYYRRYATVVELDGRIAHPVEAAGRDRLRDNAESAAGNKPLRYGWADVEETPCDTAAQVIAVLRAGGWDGNPRPCDRPGCLVSSLVSAGARLRRPRSAPRRGRGDRGGG